ncbi:MAG: prepilin-type N-terminal cleavage/methylation domain-containing protein [Sedimentisphaerales bacterium]
MAKRKGFTLVEILIVVAILGILAAIVIPHFTSASDEAKLSALASDLQTIRTQLELYKSQHNGKYAGLTTGATFVAAMTGCTKADGTKVTGPGVGIFGPYLQKIPVNPFDNYNTVNTGSGDDPPNGEGGWYFNTSTGAFYANDPDHTTL